MKRGLRPPVALSLLAILLLLCACGGGGSSSPPSPPPPPPQPVLTITTNSNVSAVIGVPFSLTLQAANATGTLTWKITAGILPDGLSLDSSTGIIFGTPTSPIGQQTVIQVSDTKSTASKQFVFSLYTKLILNPVAPPNAHLSALYSLQILAQGQPVRTWTISAGQLPPGLQLVPNVSYTLEAHISGTPTQSGSYSFTVSVQDYTLPQTATLDLTIVVDTHLAISKPNLQVGGQGKTYADSFVAVNGTQPFQWSVSALPGGLALDPATGQVTGTPTVFGLINFTVSVSDSSSPPQSDMQQGSISLLQQLAILGSLSDAFLNQSYYQSLLAIGGQPPYHWSITSGQLPPGITFNQQYGYISGSGTQLGSYQFVLEVQDSSSPPYVLSQTVDFHVKPTPLLFGGSPAAPAPLGVTYHSQVPLRGGIPPYTLTLVSGQMPPGISLDFSTGSLDGIPSQLGSFSFLVRASDSFSPPQMVAATFNILITLPLGRNDTIATATPLGNGSWLASISPYVSPSTTFTPNPDIDYYKLFSSAGSKVHLETYAERTWPANPLDSVIEVVDLNGQRLNACTSPAFTAPCLNDDVDTTTLDSGLELNVPGAAGTQTTFYVRVFDWRGDARADMQYYLNVSGVIDPLVILPSSLGLGATRGVSYQQQFSTQGGTGATSWSVSAGSLPPGWSLSSSGLLSGIATTNGTYTFTIQATDSANPPQTTTAQYALLIADPLTITSPAVWPDACSGQPYSFAIQTAGGVPPIHFGFFSSGWVAINLDTSTGIFSGTSTFIGTVTGTVSAGDSAQPMSGQVQQVTLHIVSCP